MNTVIKGLYTLIRNEYCNELFKPLTVMLIIGFLLLSGYILFKCFEVLISIKPNIFVNNSIKIFKKSSFSRS